VKGKKRIVKEKACKEIFTLFQIPCFPMIPGGYDHRVFTHRVMPRKGCPGGPKIKWGGGVEGRIAYFRIALGCCYLQNFILFSVFFL
jgi:hypothetical protein